MEIAREIPENSDRLSGIHGLRAIAALTVVVFHVQGIHQLAIPPSFSIIKTHFGLGVQLFFVLSAFSLFFSTQHRVGRPHWIQDYSIRRFFRIAPLFYIMLVVWFLMAWFKFNQRVPLYDLLLNFSFLFNLVPGRHDSIVWAGWTIGVEMLFYAVLPVLLVYVRTIRLALILVLIGAAVSLASRMAYDSSGLPLLQGYGHHAFLTQFGIFCGGVLSYFLYWRRATYRFLSENPALYDALSVCGLGLMILLLASPTESLILFGRTDILVWGIAFALLAGGQASRPWPVFANRSLFFAGERSFSIYLLHPFIIYELGPVYSKIYSILGSRAGIAFICCVLATFIVLLPASAITYRLIEAPGMDIGRWLISRNRDLNGRNSMTASAAMPLQTGKT
ncbi:MAG: acyltransferase [Candidatus Competibacteraceae bacterium]|nr:acyltransferase [Candidatus Competibacteraceae bacterium]MBK8897156.1 acyltransferase [Candidatus Competibacteraceae bacterium]MBK9952637.1 acyltransferase [Candidatus Competibacteraceae bacterium]